MADTFRSLWNEIRLHCPFVPIPLAQRWVRDRYRRAWENTIWGGAVAESQFLIPAAVTDGTVTVTYNSTTVTGTAGVWTAALVGRQFMSGTTGPYYTITDVPGVNTLTLERAFGGVTATGALYKIVQAYVTPPSDFWGFKSVKDPVNGWRLVVGRSQEWLDTVDPQRANAGTPWVVVNYKMSSAGIPMYELWPRMESQGSYPFLYYKQVPDLVNDTDTPIFPISGDIIKKGALADLAKWQGLEDRKNPAFGLQLSNLYEREYQDALNDVMRNDQEMYLTDVMTPEESYDNLPMVPFSASFWQNHAVF